MHYSIKVSIRKVKNHTFYYKGIYDHEFIKAGEKYIQVTNGTIGQGARYINIRLDDLQRKIKDYNPDEIPF